MLLTVRYDAREVDRLMYGSLGFLFYESMQSLSIRSMRGFDRERIHQHLPHTIGLSERSPFSLHETSGVVTRRHL